MKVACFAFFVFILFGIHAEAAIHAGPHKIPEEVEVQGIRVPAGTYGINIEESTDPPTLSIVQGDAVVATVPVIVLPARGTGETSIAVIRAGKHDYVRLQIRNDDLWYLVYLLTTHHSAPGSQR